MEEKNFKKKYQNLLNFVTFIELQEKSVFLKVASQTLQTEDFLNIFLRFWGFCGSFYYKNFSYKKVYFCGLYQDFNNRIDKGVFPDDLKHGDACS